MDPKSKFANAQISSSFIIELVNEQQAKGNDRNWGLTADAVKQLIMENSQNETITYFDAIKILNNSATSKMHGLANKGLGSIKESVKMHIKDILKEQDNEALNKRSIP